ncbi:MAG: UDP-N-acetylmuramyl-tripeptide synthetase [Parcubacteria group bacterium]|nr:UDP-N-acetylmuramyl-tripeptide synthetase [Parcubacteria group bacterium]
MERFLFYLKKFIPKKIFSAFQPAYHYTLALLGAIFFRFPSRNIFVIAVTGTKGKTTTIELLNAMLEGAGYKTALSNSLRFKIGKESMDNTFKMTMPGRFFMHAFLRKAVRNGCAYAIIEITSEGVKLFRNQFIALNTLIFTNLAPEHIESHGSYEKYRDAKVSIAESLKTSRKKRKFIIVNGDDKEAGRFLSLHIKEKYSYSLKDAEPYELHKETLSLTLYGERVQSRLSGVFNIYNILAAAACAKNLGISNEVIKNTVHTFSGVPGRMEYVDEGQDFTVLVDYAHTPDSLEKVYETFPHTQKICVLGAAGGGRDVWKRKELGAIANTHCSKIILTNEDPYDENPLEIVHNVEEGIGRDIAQTIMDRRGAILEALKSAKTGDAVIITGKGSEPYIMGPEGSKLPWSDVAVVREELRKIRSEQK